MYYRGSDAAVLVYDITKVSFYVVVIVPFEATLLGQFQI